MGFLAYLPLLMTLLPGREIPAGTHLEIRLTTPVGTYASKPGSTVSAVLTAAVIAGDHVLLPAGSTLAGEVKSVRRVGLGIVHETAEIELEFQQVTLSGSTTIPISARVIEVDNARERVAPDGRIYEQRSTASLSTRASGYVRMAVGLNVHAQLGIWAVKSVVVNIPEPEIYYPAGAEMTLALNARSWAPEPGGAGAMPRTLIGDELAALDGLTGAMPERTTNRSRRASDLINVMFIGTREQLSAAFLAAGWSETPRANLASHLRNIRAVLEEEGNRTAPMSTLLLDGEAPDMMWQKGLNDVGKRHHIRIWKRKETSNGQEIWVGAATHDVDFAYLRPGMPVTHRIAPEIDRERDKVVRDLQFASCVDLADWMERPEVSREMHNATGDRMTTDGRLAVVRLRDRPAPQLSVEFPLEPLPAHGKRMERFARREILSMRNELIRNNSYWRSYEAIRFAVTAARRHKEQEVELAKAEPKALERVTGLVALR
jgi:hypothetical protein